MKISLNRSNNYLDSVNVMNLLLSIYMYMYMRVQTFIAWNIYMNAHHTSYI